MKSLEKVVAFEFGATEEFNWSESMVLSWKMVPKIDRMCQSKRP
jgi:hypothetical protein